MNSVKVYVPLDVPHNFSAIVPDGDSTVKVKWELPLLTRQFTVTDVMLLLFPEQLPEESVEDAVKPFKEFNFVVVLEK